MGIEINLGDLYLAILAITATIISLLFALKDNIDKRFDNIKSGGSTGFRFESSEQYFSVKNNFHHWWALRLDNNLCSLVIWTGLFMMLALALSVTETSLGYDAQKSIISFLPVLKVSELLYSAWVVWLSFCLLFMGRLSVPHKQS